MIEAPTKARPTEYKNIRFNSKSEAILACNFDLLGLAWEYEPPVPGDWRPDFYIFGACTLFRFGMYIEYKPKGCTDTYKKELAERYTAMKREQRRNRDGDFIWEMCALLCFSPYARKNYDLHELEMYGLENGAMRRICSGEINGEALLGKIPEAKGYRFDLKYEEPKDEFPF